MTGFARDEGGDDSFGWTWEAKSVNGRSRDLRCRLPQGYERLEETVRARVAALFTRGNLQIALNLTAARSRPAIQLNRELLGQVLAVLRELETEQGIEAPRADGLLAVPGLLESVEEQPEPAVLEAREAALLAGLEAALEALAAARRAEGARLAELVEQHLVALEGLIDKAGGLAATQPETLRARLKEQVETLLETVPALPEERLAQEVAVLATKADVREELDRLSAHVAAARELLAAGGAVGRRLDFLCQELNREANTLCAKSVDMTLTQTGLEMKSTVEQLREQVQNVE
jgi:uncharacterized protein (TIGR00255 family)